MKKFLSELRIKGIELFKKKNKSPKKKELKDKAKKEKPVKEKSENGKGTTNLLAFKSIRARIMFGFSIVIALVAILGITIGLSMNAVKSDTERIMDEELPILLANEKLQINITERISAAQAYVLYGTPNYVQRFDNLSEESIELEQSLLDSMQDTTELEAIISQTRDLEEYIRNDVFQAYADGKENMAGLNLGTVNSKYVAIRSAYMTFVEDQETTMENKGKDLVSSANASMIVTVVISVLVILVSVAIGFVVNLISKPIRQVSERMEQIANGDLSHDPLESKSSDEIGVLVAATNKMNENLQELLGKISNVSDSVSGQSDYLTQAASEVKEGSYQVASTMQELSSGAETQANHASELATAMATFSEKVNQANISGEVVYESSQEVLGLTQEGRNAMDLSISQMKMIDQIVQEAVDKVKGLDQQSQKITKLVGVIKDIADQTNLLALNAAIEAARAGEHGRGFAVVADEVRKLAEQVSLSVTDITQIVTSIQSETNSVTDSLTGGYKQVEGGMNQVISTGETFERINNALIEMSEGIKSISTNLSDIASNSEEMNKSVEEIAAVSEESAAGIEQTSASVQQTTTSMEEVSASSKELAGLTESLNDLIARFKLKE
ncbi:methyl-accepting chemotaxis protein [Aquibacillus koreensis]|uniref:Methyl-accepting chemotaxis protein n=1 Tax=Aquibacillus koreensis TaxID=279446 RepID=A0A9X3WIM6_9BACI|nr:methyl-accepting chemotaxis protein [Aquibacillus koreensis]MCT2535954.1 methyl-accepting chemotaxis protein [Aquibacillus koreensis]MDC3420410.1 methyl-accepting chemotaxis protein [Aquibacillus koreensis]